MVTLIYILSTILFFLWLPILSHFWKSWKTRKNPISLAICSGILYFLYVAVNNPLFVKSDKESVLLATAVANLMVCVAFYVAFKWAEVKWMAPKGMEREEESSQDK